MHKEWKVLHKGYFTLAEIKMRGHKREVLMGHDSVSLLVFIPKWQKIILLRQPRVGMISRENKDGRTMELIAGRVDKELSIKDIIIDEAKVEAGVNLHEEQIVFLNRGKPMAVSAGALNEKSYLAYAEVEPEQIDNVSQIFWGDREEGEIIERHFIDLQELPEFICEDVRTFVMIQFLLLKLFGHTPTDFICTIKDMMEKERERQ